MINLVVLFAMEVIAVKPCEHFDGTHIVMGIDYTIRVGFRQIVLYGNPLMGEGVLGAGDESVGDILAHLRPRLFGDRFDHVGEHSFGMTKRGSRK